jgi:hypothetical protein
MSALPGHARVGGDFHIHKHLLLSRDLIVGLHDIRPHFLRALGGILFAGRNSLKLAQGEVELIDRAEPAQSGHS